MGGGGLLDSLNFHISSFSNLLLTGIPDAGRGIIDNNIVKYSNPGKKSFSAYFYGSLERKMVTHKKLLLLVKYSNTQRQKNHVVTFIRQGLSVSTLVVFLDWVLLQNACIVVQNRVLVEKFCTSTKKLCTLIKIGDCTKKNEY